MLPFVGCFIHCTLHVGTTLTLQELADEIEQTPDHLRGMIRRFLFDQVYEDNDIPSECVDLEACPTFSGNVGLYTSATTTFYAPSELAGTGGMHREVIRSTASWYNQYERRDTVLIQTGSEDDPMGGMTVARVLRFLSVVCKKTRYPFAYVEWYKRVSNAPHPLTGMWEVTLEKEQGQPVVGMVHLDCIVRACHLIANYGRATLPHGLHFANSLDVFPFFFVNHFSDYHAHECIPRT